MARFFIEAEMMKQDFIILTGSNADHAKVLRLKNGEIVTVCDGAGNECSCTISDVSPGQVCLVVNDRKYSDSESMVKVSVYMAFSKGDKFEHVVQKATELGAFEIIAFPSARCVSRPDEKSLGKKVERWQKIAASAAEQSGRGLIPKVTVLSSYKQALSRAREADIAILFYENERAKTLKMALNESEYKTVSFLTGSEGGFEGAFQIGSAEGDTVGGKFVHILLEGHAVRGQGTAQIGVARKGDKSETVLLVPVGKFPQQKGGMTEP
jgi:16S rRNA (uracil1498-N3)-methyltransferase